MRNGLKVFDADTHLQPSAETLELYLDSHLRELVPDLEQHKVPIKIGLAGEVREAPFRHMFRFGQGERGWGGGVPRILGEAGPREGAARRFQKFMGAKFPTEGGHDWDADARIRDMDEEGVDVQLMVPSGANGHSDPAVEMGFIRANHRFLNDFTSKHPHRLKSLIVATARSIEESIVEIKTWARSPWAVGVQIYLPQDYPLDHPSLNPVWAAVQEEGLCVVHHSFAAGYPGQRDLWDNPFLGRTASHPWAAMRAVAAFFGGGIMERYPEIRFGIIESGFGWLPFWAKRMDDQVVYMGYVAENLQHSMSEYMTGGRFFAGIVLHEGQDMVKMTSEQLGDSLLMFGSDYPHAESRFPGSVDLVLGWDKLGQGFLRKLMWDNPVRFYGEP